MPLLTDAALKAGLESMGRKHNMYNGNMQAVSYNNMKGGRNDAEKYAKADAECKKLKAKAHDALSVGRDKVNAGDNKTANHNFAFAYQMRCVCDWIWSHAMGERGDQGHAYYLHLSAHFSQIATGAPLPRSCGGAGCMKCKACITAKINEIKDK